MYTHQTTIRLRDTDAAGVIYFASVFDLAHEAFEAFMDSIGISVGLIIRSTEYVLPIVHAEADYKRPMFIGDAIHIQAALEQLGETSFTVFYRFLNLEDEETATARITHVVLNRKERKKKILPPELLAGLHRMGTVE